MATKVGKTMSFDQPAQLHVQTSLLQYQKTVAQTLRLLKEAYKKPMFLWKGKAIANCQSHSSTIFLVLAKQFLWTVPSTFCLKGKGLGIGLGEVKNISFRGPKEGLGDEGKLTTIPLALLSKERGQC